MLQNHTICRVVFCVLGSYFWVMQLPSLALAHPRMVSEITQDCPPSGMNLQPKGRKDHSTNFFFTVLKGTPVSADIDICLGAVELIPYGYRGSTLLCLGCEDSDMQALSLYLMNQE